MLKQLFQSKGLIAFFVATVIIVIARIFSLSSLYLFFTPFTTLSLMYEYHTKTEKKDQTLYFILVFCLMGDLIITQDDFYSFTAGLMAYWGTSILAYVTLQRELNQPLTGFLRKKIYIIPFVTYGIYFFILMRFIRPFLGTLFIPIFIYAATLSFSAVLSIVVYLHKKTAPTAHFVKGMVLLSIAASIIGLNRFIIQSNVLHGIETLIYALSLFYLLLYFKTKTDRDF